ncbi:MAG TPA: isoamylase early set domain-containing protein [Gemmatimonadales bacterium]|nr:isoamylase early set domain-containing protein [Gemmatimonadales bacterium]
MTPPTPLPPQLDPRLQEALDGERDPVTLPDDLRAAYARLIEAGELLRQTPPHPRVASVAERVMAEVRRPAPRPSRELARWFAEPQAVTLRLRPVWTLALAAALAAIVLLPGREPGGGAPGAQEGVAQFVGHFPGARSVEVVGSFNDWRRGSLPLRDEDNDGIWHAAAFLPAGPHEYMFVVDGERWVADPLAGRYVDDGFGRANALLIVRGGGWGTR